jgi:hypothetical protein
MQIPSGNIYSIIVGIAAFLFFIPHKAAANYTPLSVVGVADTSNQLTYTKTKVRRKGKVVVHTAYNKKTNRLHSKQKIKDGKQMYFIEYNNKGKMIRYTNKKGIVKDHKPPCDC